MRAPVQGMRAVTAAAVAVVAAVALGAGGVAPAAPLRQAPPPAPPPPPPVAVQYLPPIDAPVVAGFDAPADPYGPGNRGIEYAAALGAPVRAAAAGTVTFAGPVAGAWYVTVQHADRLRTTYGRLAGVAVHVGASVQAGTVVGTATPSFIWTARLRDAYLDPAVLLAASGRPVLRLVPVADRARRSGPGSAQPAGVTARAAAWALEATGS